MTSKNNRIVDDDLPGSKVKRKTPERNKLLALAAGVVVLITGSIVLTSAAYSESITAGAETSAASTIALAASDDNVIYTSPENTGELTFDTTGRFKELQPDSSTTAWFWIKNVGTAGVVTDADINVSGQMFGGALPATATITGIAAGDLLVPDEAVVVSVTVTTPPDWIDYQGTTGKVLVTITGANQP